MNCTIRVTGIGMMALAAAVLVARADDKDADVDTILMGHRHLIQALTTHDAQIQFLA